MYIDGILIKKEIHPNKNSLTYPSKIYVGKGINNRFLSMKLFSIRIYNRVLDDFEIKQDSFFVKNKVYVNENNLPIIVDKLTDAKNIKISNNKYGNRVQTVVDKIVEKADDVTKAIKQEVINDSYSFKVGTGNVDVSSDVEDGFGEVGLKGVAYQNLFNSLEIKPYSYTTVVGSRFKTIVAETPTHQYGHINIPISELYKFKPNHKYTLFVNITKNTFINKDDEETIQRAFCINTYNYAGNMIESSNEGNYSLIFEQGVTGMKKCVITTKNFDNPSKPINNCFELYIGSYYTKAGCELSGEFIIVEGDHINNPNMPSYFEGIVGVGDKSKNLLNPNSFKSSTGISMIENQVINIDVPTDGGQRTIFEGLNLPAGTYRVTTKVLEGEYTGGNLLFYDSNGEKFTENRLIGSYTINATNNNINKLLIWAVKGICKIRIQLEKGSSETPYEPYYDGHKIEILSNGKNLFNNKNNFITGGSGFAQTVGQMVTLSGIGDSNHKYLRVKLPIGKKYTVTIDKRNTYPNGWSNTIIESISDNIIVGSTYKTIARNNNSSSQISMLTFETSMPYVFIHIGRKNNDQAYEEWFAKVLESFETMQIEENDTSSEFEPYQEDKTQILLDEPLMRLPNGVCDEITRDGKLIRRIGKVLLDGSQHFNQQRVFDDRIVFGTQIDNILVDKRGGILPIADNFPCANQSDVWNGIVEGLGYSDIASGHIRVSINKSRLSPENRDGLKNFFTTNPTTLYYQLNTPTITDITPATLRIFKNGHLTFNTLVAPESNHVVQLNKSAQIERSIREVQGLNNRINVLENNYDNLMLSTISRLNDLELDYTLK